MTDTDCISVYELFKIEERTTLYDQNINSKARVVVNQGGTSSGKTYAIMQVLFELGYEEPNQIITVVGQDIPNLKVGAYRDAKTIMDKYDTVDAAYPQINEGERIIKGFNGSIIEFKSYADAQDAKSGKRDYLFINEANGISYEVYWQLAIRTRKKIFIDYNPSARFWVHDELIGREGVETLYSWYKHNQFLTDEECKRIEGISDPELHKVYARGKTGKIEGLVLTNWDICDSLPPQEEWKMSCRGLDFGFTCFKGDTLIMTSEGEKPIMKVRAGDLVLTRKGYRGVKQLMHNGIKKVIQKRFVDGLRQTNVSCTYKHNFNANGKWKKYGQLTEKDNLFLLSSSTAWSSADTQAESTQTTTITSGRKMECSIQNYCTTQSMKRLMEKSPMVWLSIIRTSIRLIMTLAIWLCSVHRNICGFIIKLANGQKSIQRNLENDVIQKIIGTSEERKCSKISGMKEGCADGVVRSLHQQTHISDFAESNATIDGNIKHQRIMSSWFASIAERLSKVINTLNRNVAAWSVPINYRCLTEIQEIGEEWCDVYDLEIEDVHEYFANGILVHNCDPTALEHVILAHGELYIDEEIYSTGLTNPDIVSRAREQGIASEHQIIADCAEPKSIRELQAGGLWVTASLKGKDSIVSGLDILKRYRMHVTRRSIGILSNLRAYRWGKDKDGNNTNKPEDRNNHGIDAIRYVALAKLGERRPVRGVRRKN